MSTCCGKRFGKTPCRGKEYTLEVIEHCLASGTATLLVRKDGQPLKCNVIGVSFCIIPPSPSTDVICDKCCTQYVTDQYGKVDVKFDGDAQNQVRINVNINLGACGTDCACIRLTKCLVPESEMDACPLAYLSLDEGQSCGKCCK